MGDRIIATNGMDPTGGLAEYAAVKTKCAGKAPAGIDPAQAAVLPNSPVTAMHAARAACLKEGDRVMVLGGSGGVGSSLLQFVKDAKVKGRGRTKSNETKWNVHGLTLRTTSVFFKDAICLFRLFIFGKRNARVRPSFITVYNMPEISLGDKEKS